MDSAGNTLGEAAGDAAKAAPEIAMQVTSEKALIAVARVIERRGKTLITP